MGTIRAGLASAAIAAVVALSSTWPNPASGAPTPGANASGKLHVPADYRQTYEYLGSWAIADEKTAGAEQMHIVFGSPGAAAAYARTGRFPANSVLIKEVFEAASDAMTTAPVVSRAGRLLGWFVMVRGDERSHPGNPLWGDGWGWSWFDANDRDNSTSKSYKSECESCHIPAAMTDRVYIQGYPKLQR